MRLLCLLTSACCVLSVAMCRNGKLRSIPCIRVCRLKYVPCCMIEGRAPFPWVSFQEGLFSVDMYRVDAISKADCEPPSWAVEKGPSVASSVAKAGTIAQDHLALARSVLDKSNYGRDC